MIAILMALGFGGAVGAAFGALVGLVVKGTTIYELQPGSQPASPVAP